ncbi:MAG: hypothetical protein V4713_16765 [Pseudomonadota bacterium]
MNTNLFKEPPYEIVNSLQSMLEFINDVAKVVTTAGEDIFKIQTESCAAGITGTLTGLTPSFSPEGPINLLWKLPSQYQAQSERMVQAMLDTLAVISRVQQQELQLLGPSLHRNIENTTKTITQLNGALASRRATAEVINFADRRVAAERYSQAAAESSGDVEQGHDSSARQSKKRHSEG